MVTPDCARARNVVADLTAKDEVKNVEDRRLGSPWPWDGKPPSDIALLIFRISKLLTPEGRERFAVFTSCSCCQSNQAGTSSYVIWSEKNIRWFSNISTMLHCIQSMPPEKLRTLTESLVAHHVHRQSLGFRFTFFSKQRVQVSDLKQYDDNSWLFWNSDPPYLCRHEPAVLPISVVLFTPVFVLSPIYFHDELNPQFKLQETLKPADLKHTFVIGEPKAPRDPCKSAKMGGGRCQENHHLKHPKIFHFA